MLATVLLPFALALSGGTQTLHVDPVLGVDSPGNGALAQPLRTIAFALAQVTPGNALDLRLLPGTYSETSGEIFPLVLPYDTVVTSLAPKQAVVRKQQIAVSTLFSVPAGSTRARFVDVVVDSFDRGIQAIAEAEDALLLEVVGCEVSGSRGVMVLLQDGVADVRIERTRLGGAQWGLRVDASGAAFASVAVDRSHVQSGMHGIELVAGAPASSITSVVRDTVFDHCGFQGIRVVAESGGSVHDVVDSCVFYRVGLPAQPPKKGAITEVVGAGSIVTHVVTNSVFHENGDDLPQYAATHWQVASCLFQEPALCGLPTNVCGDPLFVDAPHEDFHLAPGSPAIDAGSLGPVTSGLDVDGDPRPGHPTLSGPPLQDIGIDEAYDRAVHVMPNPTPLGGALTLRWRGPSGSLAALLVSSAENGAPFGSGLRVALPLLADPLLVGIVPAAPLGVGILEANAVVPDHPVLLGVELVEQAAFGVAGSGVELGYGVVRHRFR